VTTYSSVRWDVLDRDFVPVGSITADTRDDLGVLTNDGRSRVRRTCRGVSFIRADLRDVNLFTDAFRCVWLQDGVETVLGTMYAADDPKRLDDRVASLYLADETIFIDVPALYTIGVSPGDVITTNIENVARIAGVQRFVVTPSNAVVLDPIAWPRGTPIMSILIDLCQLVGYLPPYFDRFGVLQCAPPPPLDSAPVAVYDETNHVRGTGVVNDNLLTAPNVFTVVNGGATETEIAATAVVPADAPHSITARGRTVPRIVRAQGIASQAAAAEMASSLAATAVDDFEEARFVSAPNPVHDTYDVVSFMGRNYREVTWTLELRPGGSHVHELNRARPGDVLF